MRYLALCLACLALLVACGPPQPKHAGRLGPGTEAADFPVLLPLGPLLERSDLLPPSAAEREGQSLQARAADLRRRAAALREIAL